MNKNLLNRSRIKDIADRAGVSSGTVDRVLHNRGEVAQRTKDRVLAIAEELNYTPNILAKSLALKKAFYIAALIPSSGKDNPYWEMPRAGMEIATAEVRDFNADIRIFDYDINSSSSLKEAFDRLIASKPDGLVFAPLLSGISHDICKECEKQNIPFVLIDANLDGCNYLTFFGQNGEASGYLAARLMHHCLDAGSSVVLINPVRGDAISHQVDKRGAGFLSFFNSDANRKKIGTLEVEVNIAGNNSAKNLVRIFQGPVPIGGIFIANSKAFKIAEVLEREKIHHVLLIGYDLIEKNISYLKKGIISYLIGQKPEDQGYRSIMALFHYLMGKRLPEKTNYSPIDIIMKENIEYYKTFKP